MQHARRIERAFATQAGAFEDPARNQVFTSDARWVFERLPLTADDVVLGVAEEQNRLERPLTPWLEQARTPAEAAEAIRAVLRSDLDGKTATGLRPRASGDGDLWFTQIFGSAIAAKPA